MLENFIKLLFLFQTVFVCAKGITYTTYTGKCEGGVDYENEAGKRVFSSKDCGSICNQDEACTGYNTKSTSNTWCQTYTSKFIRIQTSNKSQYPTWTCFVKDDPDYEVIDGLCVPVGGRVMYTDKKCKERCDASPTCTGITFLRSPLVWASTVYSGCGTHTSEELWGLQTYNFGTLWGCAYKKRMDYKIFVKTGSDGSNDGYKMTFSVHGTKGDVTAGNLGRSVYDLPSNSISEYSWTLRDVGDINKITISTTGNDRACIDYITILTEKDPLPVLFRNKDGYCLTTNQSYGRRTLDFHQSLH